MSQTLMTLPAPALLSLFQEALDGQLVERGAGTALELLGSPEQFWRALDADELQRMAEGGNAAAQAELAWRHCIGEGVAKS